MKRILLLITTVLIPQLTQAQCGNPGFYCMDDGTFTVSDYNTVSDDAGGGPYTDTDYTMTLCPDTPGDVVQLTFSAFALQTSPNANNSDYLSVFDGDDTSAPSLGDYTGSSIQGLQITGTVFNTTGCLTLVFSSNGQPNAASPGFEAQILCTTPCANPTAASEILNPSPDDPAIQTVSVCMDTPITFGDNGSAAAAGFALAEWIWNFDDGTVVTNTGPGSVSHSFSEPGEYIITLTVEDNNLNELGNGCQSLNILPLQVLVSTYPTFSGMTDLETCLGETVIGAVEVGDPDALPGGDTEIGGGASGTTWTALPPQVVAGETYLADGAGFSYSTSLVFDFFEADQTLENCDDLLSIFVNMEHSYMGDLGLFITCPDGTMVNLVEWGTNGGGGTFLGEAIDNENTEPGVGYDYFWDPDATNGTWGENATGIDILPTGSYEAAGDLCDLVGCPLNGEWSFTVTDNLAIDNGYIFYWGIAFNPELYPGVTTFTPTIGSGPDSSYWVTAGAQWITDVTPDGDQISITPETEGVFDYTYTVINSFGCEFDTTIQVTITQAPLVSAGLDQLYSCGAVTLEGSLIGDAPVACSECGTFNYCYDAFDFYQATYCPDVPGQGVITITFMEGSAAVNDNLNVYDGPNTWPSPWLGGFTGDLSGQSWTSTDPSGCLTFFISEWDGVDNCADGGADEWTYVVTATSSTAANFVWDWNPGTGLDFSNIQTPTVIDLTQTTTYTLTGYPAGHPACGSTDEVIVSVDPLGDPGLDNNITVCSTDAPFSMIDELLGTPVSTGIWYDVNDNPIPDGMFDPMTDPAGNYEYRVEFANCLAFSVLTIEMAGPTVINIPNDTTICAGGSISLDLYDLDNGQAPFSYTWDYDGVVIGNQQNASHTPLQSGNACLTVLDDCGFSITECFAVEVLPGIDVVFSADTTMACYPEVYTLTNGVDPTFYQTSEWTISNGNEINNEDEITIGFEYPGTYTVTLTLTNSLGCAYSATYDNYLTSFAPPIAGYTADPQPTNIEDTEIQFTDATQGAEIVEYRWRFFDMSGQQIGASAQANPNFEFPNDFGGLYNVFMEVTDINGCTDAITPGIIDIDDLLQFYVPTAFTPNNDGVNDVLFFEGADINPDRFSVKVFNRYGDKVFETADPSTPWVGDTYDGEYFVPNGAYNWVAIVVSDSTGERRELSGSVMVIR